MGRPMGCPMGRPMGRPQTVPAKAATKATTTISGRGLIRRSQPAKIKENYAKTANPNVPAHNQNGGRGKIGLGDFAMGPIGGGEISFRGLTPSDRITHGPMRKWRGEDANPPWQSVPLHTDTCSKV